MADPPPDSPSLDDSGELPRVRLTAVVERVAGVAGSHRLARLEVADAPARLREALGAQLDGVAALAALLERGCEVTARTRFVEVPRDSASAGVLVAKMTQVGRAAFALPESVRDFEALGARIFRPARPRLAEALAAVLGVPAEDVRRLVAGGGHWRWRAAAGVLEWAEFKGAPWKVTLATTPDGLTSATDAWEAFAARSLVPLAWVGDEKRAFWEPARSSSAAPTTDAPRALPLIVALASDPEGVARVEALAREWIERAAPWGWARPTRVRWQLMSRTEGNATVDNARPTYDVGRWDARTPRALLALLESSGALPGGLETRMNAMRAGMQLAGRLRYLDYEVTNVLRHWLGWKTLAERGLVLPADFSAPPLPPRRYDSPPSPPEPPVPAAGRKLAELPNPFEPLVAILEAGYWVGGANDACVALVAPDV